MYRSRLLLFFLIVSIIGCKPEKPKDEENTLKAISSYFPEEKSQVLFVGLFHFDYPGLDVMVTAEEDKIDVLKEPKKSELSELVNYIKRFKPNKIAIEARPSWKATEKLHRYINGELRDQRDERIQVGFRIANELNLDTIYSIDTDGFANELGILDSAYANRFFKDFDFQSEDPYEKIYKKWFETKDKWVSKTKLLEYVKFTNSEESFNYDHGAYLIGDFKLDEYRGADITALWWYSRNLRIFRNIQKIATDPKDRLLVIYGTGHGPILKHLIESSPEMEWVNFSTLD